MNNMLVGEDIILPRSLRSQNAHPYVAKTKISISPVGVGALDDPFLSTMILKGSPRGEPAVYPPER